MTAYLVAAVAAEEEFISMLVVTVYQRVRQCSN